MRNSTFKPRVYGRRPVVYTPIERAGIVRMVADEVVANLKEHTYRSEAWLKAVRPLHCMRCFKEGRTQAAHRNQGKGMAIKADDCLTAALCVECHAEIDSGKDMTRAERREAMDVAILMTIRALAMKGVLSV